MSTINQDWRDRWSQIRKDRDRIVARGEVIILSAPTSGSRIHVVSPYNPKFREPAIALGGRWRPRSRVWTFPSESESSIVALCSSIFGSDKIRLHTRPDIQGSCDSVSKLVTLLSSTQEALRQTRERLRLLEDAEGKIQAKIVSDSTQSSGPPQL